MSGLKGTAGEKVGIRTFAYTFVPPAIVMLGVGLSLVVLGIPVENLTSEPTTIADVPAYTGAVSTIGVMGWAAAVGMYLMGAALLYEKIERKEAAFLAYGATFTAYLAIDDAFAFHESVLPSIGISENATYAVLLGLVIVYALLFRPQIRNSAWLFLVLAVTLIAASVAVDLIWEMLDPSSGFAIQLFLEDGLKLFGICAWVAYSAMSTRGLLRRHLAEHDKAARLPHRGKRAA